MFDGRRSQGRCARVLVATKVVIFAMSISVVFRLPLTLVGERDVGVDEVLGLGPWDIGGGVPNGALNVTYTLALLTRTSISAYYNTLLAHG